MWGAIIPAAASIISGLISSEGQEDANRDNRMIAEQNSAFNAAQAQKQMDFQREMSGTAYQRAVADMGAAGLNPMLAYSQGGASSPSGAAGSAVQPAPMQNAAGAGAASAIQAMQAATNIDLTKAQTRATNADAAIKESEVPEPGTDGRPGDSATASLKRQQAQESANRQLNITADTTRINQIVNNLGQQLKLTGEQIKEVQERILNLKEEGRRINLENLFRELDIPRAHREHEYETSATGRASRYAEFYTRRIGEVINSAGTVRNMFPRKFKNETTRQDTPDGHSTYQSGSR